MNMLPTCAFIHAAAPPLVGISAFSIFLKHTTAVMPSVGIELQTLRLLLADLTDRATSPLL